MARRESGAGVHVVVVLRPAHLEKLRAEAQRRAAPGARRFDSSAVLRELLDDVLDAWLAKQQRRGKP